MKGVEIQESILKEYCLGKPLAITNYSGTTGFEADVLMVAKSGFAYEYEVKTSRSDFKKDFSKVAKHKHLQNPKVPLRGKRGYPLAPNYFYYVCVDGLIRKDEIPKYAGLIHIVAGIPVIMVRAPRLHSHKLTEHLKQRIGTTLSFRSIFGSSYLRHAHGNNN